MQKRLIVPRPSLSPRGACLASGSDEVHLAVVRLAPCELQFLGSAARPTVTGLHTGLPPRAEVQIRRTIPSAPHGSGARQCICPTSAAWKKHLKYAPLGEA